MFYLLKLESLKCFYSLDMILSLGEFIVIIMNYYKHL